MTCTRDFLGTGPHRYWRGAGGGECAKLTRPPRRPHLADGGHPAKPEADELAALRDQIADALAGGSVPFTKALLQALVDEIRVDGRDRVMPWFGVRGGAEPKVCALGGWGAPGRIRTCATGSGGRCSIP